LLLLLTEKAKKILSLLIISCYMRINLAKILLVINIVSLMNIVSAQTERWMFYRKELLVGTGASNFLGELGGKDGIGTNDMKDFDVQAIRPLLHVGYCYKISRNISWRNDLTFAYLTGNDKYTNEEFRNNRNINFRTPIFELASTINYFLLSEKEGARYTLTGYRLKSKRRKGFHFFDKMQFDIYPYIFGGVSLFYFNPQSKFIYDENVHAQSLRSLDGDWINLKPLKTEGQGIIPTRKDYSLVQLSIPLGIGFKYVMDRTFAVGLEYGIRITFTDYIDDTSVSYVDPQVLKDYHGEGQTAELAVHFANPSTSINSYTSPGQQRGDIRDNDAYMFAKITLYYKLMDRTRSPIPKFR